MKDHLNAASWPEYQLSNIRREFRRRGRAYVEGQRNIVKSLREAMIRDSARPVDAHVVPLPDGGSLTITGASQHPDLAAALAQVDIILQRMSVVLDQGGEA